MGELMEKLITELFGNGVAGLLAAICVLTSLNLLARLGGFLWNLKANREKLSDETIQKLTDAVAFNTSSTERNTLQIVQLEKTLAEIPKLKSGLRRAFSAIKKIAGKEWPNVQKEIQDEINFFERKEI
jgi:hypothetical protein